MKINKLYIISIALSTLLVACNFANDNEDKKEPTSYVNVVKEYDPKDSVTTFSYWINDNEADVYQIGFNKDTIKQYKYRISKYYHNYTFYNKAGGINKMYQYIKLGGNFRTNESIEFNSNNEIIREESDLIDYKVNPSHLTLFNHNKNIYNKIRILVGDTLTFEREKWLTADTLVSFADSIIVPYSYGNRCCIVQLITTDKEGNDKSGRDFFFDVNTLKCRDIRKSLVCEDIK
ncbi:MAG: hypothetical protein ACK5QC_08115 [Bacteroidota bacterium]